ncbi:carboxy-S-adenosyl-L-methionine synthase CmoA [Idiomarina zobellii]|jgi:tRNA (cmo5U34)-methyltransferase|uniref:Carboxy-S-adenosyl-L-methionine synthase n=1 Tax=Idiomarina zobellii TaxID=86103 RepID=A0A837NHJ9_9GAMM|nr:carboxy-S-adenosyl-L-methionine synthase CmoA [Idiomarina zobellii]KPD24688.1 tRNA methyltransferase [Idiomarina zobellii]SDF55236.1 tRNA (cmo5U34)-methyltransferase [Idiomarina zobellii]
MSQHDTIFSKPLPSVSDFCFDQQVVEVFPDMINRSVPGYSSILQTLPQLVSRYAQKNTQLFDLGCSLGAATLAMRKGCENFDGCKIVAVDNSEPMVERAELHLGGFKSQVPVELRCEDITDTVIENASVVVLNFTLQFVPPEKREAMIQRIYDGLADGGVLLIAEKFRHVDETMNDVLVDLHHDFKRANGYSELEISQKRAAIENVMKIDTLEAHEQRFQKVGFKHQTVWFQCFNFAAMLAVK